MAGQPAVVRTVPGGLWTTLTFDFSSEPVQSYFGGDGLLSSPSGLGVLEHVALVPLAGVGRYNFYLDNFVVVEPKTLTYSLEPDAPSGMSIDSRTGQLSWIPTAEQLSATNLVEIRVTDNGLPPLSAVRSFHVTGEDQPSLQMAISGEELTLSWHAIVGRRYRIQFTRSLLNPVWTDVDPIVSPTTETASSALRLDGSQGFYRIIRFGP
jgi:hypothetical protein